MSEVWESIVRLERRVKSLTKRVAELEAERQVALAARRKEVEEAVAWALHEGRICPSCGGTGHGYVPASTVYPQPAEYPPCPDCNGWGALAEDGRPYPCQKADALLQAEAPF